MASGTVATAADTFNCNVAIRDGEIVALGTGLGPALEEIDATGWPVSTILRGRMVVCDGELVAPAGHGQHLSRDRSPYARPADRG